MQSDAQTLTITYPAEPSSVPRARRALSDFAATAGANPTQVDAVRLAASEAVTNVVLHAYPDEPGQIHITAAVVSDELWILIGDDGCGLESRPDRPGLGLGLALIAQVSDELAVVPRAGGGIEVRMRFGLVRTAGSRSGGAVGGSRVRATPPRPSDQPGGDSWPPCRPRSRARRPA